VNDLLFSLASRTVVITGAGGLLGQEHALAVARAGGTPVLLDVSTAALSVASKRLSDEGLHHLALEVDITQEGEIERSAELVAEELGSVWGLVNNVASNPVMNKASQGLDRLERFELARWDDDLRVGLTSAFLCGKHFGKKMAESGAGSIVNIASDLAVISPDQRMYAVGIPRDAVPPVKPVSYSVVKSGLIGLTRYLATYWSPVPVRCNALLPGSVGGTQSPELAGELVSRIPLARLAKPTEYHGSLVFLLTDASAYMTGASLIMDGGRTIW
jgi:NAD(P)-dependent dehydrogenase (short-subunit alcohol dehydrogenase family)